MARPYNVDNTDLEKEASRARLNVVYEISDYFLRQIDSCIFISGSNSIKKSVKSFVKNTSSSTLLLALHSTRSSSISTRWKNFGFLTNFLQAFTSCLSRQTD